MSAPGLEGLATIMGRMDENGRAAAPQLPELAQVAAFLASCFRQDAEGLVVVLDDVHAGSLCFALAGWINSMRGRADFGDLDDAAADSEYLDYLGRVQRAIAAGGA